MVWKNDGANQIRYSHHYFDGVDYCRSLHLLHDFHRSDPVDYGFGFGYDFCFGYDYLTDYPNPLRTVRTTCFYLILTLFRLGTKAR